MKKTIFPLMAAVLVSSCAIAENQLEKIAPYPKAEAGMTRHVIELQPKSNENDYMVELVIGKTLKVDCNKQWFMGELDKKELQGWGYDYYQLEEVKGPASTMMGCGDQPPKESFVTTNLGDEAFVRYNSKLPIVVYAPKDMDVKYRVWSAEDSLSTSVKK
ncbi:serine protease inhibitor ecotin [Moellerella wisconsensis]|uniref:Serine protease inhibitor ecotin n=2 Tax=Moellerella wisconsensis TaxID=158849 RepID=A0ACD3Y4X1_9GAMM|nr:serine protease inhibitor ecotin [Moellerella wisconsensis]KLN95604.1 ecotin [Moellerella wisconsensis]UNH23344.1 serine protease inhibitor ecotin [Moellerella wisconsensis]UNH26423.1 serine protease inhibitor ecotin [Moellerella wisconsensis]UNH29840.1 serine protease inhibitor ecotin [Moellerella wisconsensis]UNH38065.1 serine protease inhibitor ecotin [Moellerella wisconsensis]